MALALNNTVQPTAGLASLNLGGTSTSPVASNKNNLGAGVSFGSNGQVNISPTQSAQNSTQALISASPYGTTNGLMSPSHPSVGSLNTGTPITAHTVTTNPDNSVTSKVTYANDGSTTTGGSSNSTTTTPPTTPALPPAPTAPIAQSAFQVDPSTLPGLTGGNYGNNSTQGNYTAYNTSTGVPTFYGTGGTGLPVSPATAPATPSITGNGNPYTPTLAATSTTSSPAAQQYTSQTAQYGAGNLPIGQQAANIAAQYGQQIANVGNKGAKFEAAQLDTGTSPVAMGEGAITAQTIANQQTALAQGEQAALLGTGQQLTAQNQAATAANSAAGQAYTGQGQTITGLSNAATLGQPQTTTPGQAVFNPTTGQYTSASSGGGSPATAPSGIDQGAWSSYINDLATGATGAIPSTITGNANLYGQLQQAVAQSNPGYNYNTAVGTASGQTSGAAATAEAPGTAAATNIITAGTAATTGTAASLQSTIGTYNDMSALNTTANQQAATVQSVLQGTGLNQNAPAFNQPINQLSGQLGSAKVTALTSAVTEMQNVYSQLLSSGGTTPSGSEAQALALLSPNSTPAQINSAISQLQTAAYNKLSGQYSQLQTENSALQSGTGGSTGNANGTITTPYGTINPNL